MTESKHTDEAWVTTTCYGCFPSCAIQVRRKDGKVIGSRGDSSVVSSLGKCCGKSLSRVADLYHPNRLKRSLVRTNPKKGIGVDPGWKEISWEEAADIVVDKLGKLRRDDPRKLVMGSMDMNNYFFQVAFCEAFGSPNSLWHGATFCGGGLHTSVAERKGIRDGDWVWVESDVTRVRGRARVTECVHPKVVGAFGIGGRWAREKKVSRGKGVHFNSLIRFDWDQVDTLCGQFDYCAKVTVYKA